jgi:hypothetical protein
VGHLALPVFQTKTLDPGFRRDDVRRSIGFKVVIPAQAGIQWLCVAVGITSFWVITITKTKCSYKKSLQVPIR